MMKEACGRDASWQLTICMYIRTKSYMLQPLMTVRERDIKMPAGQPGDPPRQPLELWVAEVATGEARCLTKLGLSSVFDE